MRRTCAFVVVVVALAALATDVAAQYPTRPAARTTVVIVRAEPTMAVDGATLFQAYCASCHGAAGRGNGPAARAIPTPVPDLTQFASTHDGDCLRQLVGILETGHRGPTEHAVSQDDVDMPNWVPIFKSLSPTDSTAFLRVRNVAKHVVTIQAK
jgi:cytochrome c553